MLICKWNMNVTCYAMVYDMVCHGIPWYAPWYGGMIEVVRWTWVFLNPDINPLFKGLLAMVRTDGAYDVSLIAYDATPTLPHSVLYSTFCRRRPPYFTVATANVDNTLANLVMPRSVNSISKHIKNYGQWIRTKSLD